MEMAKEEIFHTGKVLSIDPQFITVRIISESACASCHASGLCGMSESETKDVTVPTPVTEFYEVGEEVNVSLKASMGHKAVWIAYAAPLVILFAVIMALLGCGVSELVSGLSGIAAVAVYYLCIWLLRSKLQDQYIFRISKK